MSCIVSHDILNNCDYNIGGINQIFLLDIRDFKTYLFKDDGLYNSCFVERIRINRTGYIELDSSDNAAFTEKQDSGIYTQQIVTSVRSLRSNIESDLLLARKRKYLVIFSTHSNRMFSFGSDGGATLTFNQTSGKAKESDLYNISVDKKSIYPLFEIDKNAMKVYLLGTEDESNFITSEDLENLFEIEGYEHK